MDEPTVMLAETSADGEPRLVDTSAPYEAPGAPAGFRLGQLVGTRHRGLVFAVVHAGQAPHVVHVGDPIVCASVTCAKHGADCAAATWLAAEIAVNPDLMQRATSARGRTM